MVWLVCGLVCFILYLRGWTSSGPLHFIYLFTHPLEWLLWLVSFLGAPLMILRQVAWMFGLLGTILYILVGRYILRTTQWKPFAPYLAILVFILLTALAVSVGRMELGLRQTVAPRYLTITAWYWIVLLALFPVLEIEALYQRLILAFLAITLVVLMLGGGWLGYRNLYQRILPSYQAIQLDEPLEDDALVNIYPNTTYVRQQLEFLRQNNLSVYAERQNTTK